MTDHQRSSAAAGCLGAMAFALHVVALVWGFVFAGIGVMSTDSCGMDDSCNDFAATTGVLTSFIAPIAVFVVCVGLVIAKATAKEPDGFAQRLPSVPAILWFGLLVDLLLVLLAWVAFSLVDP